MTGSLSSKEVDTMNGTPVSKSEAGDLEDTVVAEEGKATMPGETEAEVEKALPPNPHMADFPEGGARAWLVVLGAAISLFCSFGYVNAFGVYEAYYTHVLLTDKTPSDIAWIGSIQIAFIFGSGLFSGPIFDRYGAPILVIPASIGLTLSVMLTSICTKYWHFILCQGLLGGMCQGALFTPALGAVGHYFAKKRGAALGLVIAGSSLGGVIFPIMLARLIKEVGFGWAVRIIGFLFLGLLTVACITIKGRLPPRKGTFFLPEAFKKPDYVLLVIGNFFILFGLFCPFFFIPSYAVQLGMSTDMAIYLVSILNALSLPGRILPGIIADKFGRFNLIIICASITGILIFCWLAVDSAAGLIVLTAFFGFWSGSSISLFSAVLAQVVPHISQFGTYLGMAMGITGIAGLTGAPIAGALLTKYGFTAAIAFAGSSMVIGVACIAASRWVYKPKLLAIA